MGYLQSPLENILKLKYICLYILNQYSRLQVPYTPSVEYQTTYQASIDNPEQFWQSQVKHLDWITIPSKIKNANFANNHSIKWFEDGQLNPCYNCIDRHISAGHGDKTAIIWEGDNPEKTLNITYNQLLANVSIFANILEAEGVGKGDTVVIYMPMIPAAAYAMLAAARIGAIHSVVFGGFAPSALKDRIEDCKPKLIITADEAIRANKCVPLKENLNQALGSNNIKTLIIKNTGNPINFVQGRDIWLHEQSQNPVHTNLAMMNATDPLFILYTSGSTGKPKGLVHSVGGYLLYTNITFRYSFAYQDGDVFWCTADVGWVTGHSYVIYGPLSAGATTLMFEGVPTYPTPARFWQVIDRHQVTSFYTAPTAIRALMKEGDEYLTQTSRASLRILGTVGEPINPAAWEWYHSVVGNGKCQVVDTWWQTETGGHMIAPLPGLVKPKPGYACMPFFGIEPVLLSNQGNLLAGVAEGNLCIKASWPGQATTIWCDHLRYIATYFEKFPGYYCSGDGARRDSDNYYRITGRVDDVLNLSGHRIGTAEIEAAINKHPQVCESAVVGFPHPIKGEGVYVYVILKQGCTRSDQLSAELKQFVRSEIGPIVTPDVIHVTDDLPKTRSGKIMRRIIRKIAEGTHDNFGDLASLTNPQVIEVLLDEYMKMQG